MARMIPATCHPDTTSDAERGLFALFPVHLPPAFTVLHAVSLLLGKRRFAQEAEVDFLIVHRELGWLALESPIVIIAETDGLRSHHLGDALCYVALSRAKHHLIVIGELPTPRPTAATALA